MLPERCHHAFEMTPLKKGPFLALLFLPLMLFGCGEEAESATASLGGDKTQGAELTKQLGCGSCHVIPGIEGWSVHRSVESETEFTLQGCCEIHQTTWLFGCAILSRSCRTTRCPIWVLANNRRAMLRATFPFWNE